MTMFPMISGLTGNQTGALRPVPDYQRDAVQQCDGTGSGCILIHRTVFDKLGGDWYAPHPAYPELSENLAFCMRLHDHGIPLWIDTRIKTTHHRPSTCPKGCFARAAEVVTG